MEKSMGSKHGRARRDEAGKGSPPEQAAGPRRSSSDRHASAPRKRPVLRFVVLFVVFMAAFYSVTSMAWYQNGVFQRYLNLNADVSALLLRILGEESRSVEQDVISPRMSLSIRAGCDAIEPSFMFAAAVLAFPAAMKAKLIGVVIGVPLLLLMNLVRIVSLYYIGIHAPRWFETFHVDIWQPVFILLALVFWIVWVLWAMRRQALKPV
jgi:exosortase H (IPTLxxWG-CTERM-specific)